jgi:hypothetical protein
MAIAGLNAILNQFVPDFKITNLVQGQTVYYDGVKKSFVNQYPLSAGTVVMWTAAAGIAPNTTNVFTANQSVEPIVVPNLSGTYTPNAMLSNNFQFILSGNTLINNPQHLTVGMDLLFCIDENSTGGYTVGFDTLFKWSNGNTPTFNLSANSKNMFKAYYDGSILRCFDYNNF